MTMDVERILQALAKIRESIPYELRPRTDDSKIAAVNGQTITDFELLTLAEGFDSLTAELSEALAGAHAKLHEDALRVYYAAQELARDPANAHLVPHVEAMRRAYEHDYGTPIPNR
ncbi:MAG TPA: hypothetical protein VG323_09130 [Thermoanaerobaculia bacterium]|nr:hypothetical protein [Thermoanaerobaculia bacterium]